MHVFVRARAAAIVLSAVAVGIVLEHASAATARSDGAVIARAVAAPSPTPGDTNVVYGPRNFTSPTGAQTVNVERFVVTLDSGAKYSLRVVNGDPGGANRATSGSVKLNQTTVIASTDLASGPQTIVRDVVPRSVDTITVTIGGTAGSHVVASLFATARPTVTLFGAKTYIRPNGNASSPSDNFSGIAGVGAPFTLIARNGDSTGGHRASSASVSLNG
ncbi:MAG TPA: hypothetical protein VGP95_12115, partial [Gemmatimonadaceae bacterium]|nr:hypothetical protein [Gemmatimonadaceae bacterium]